MRIAFVSYEYPPDTAFGGIGTYTFQMSSCLKERGCDVEVFTASHTREIFNEVNEAGVIVHRILAKRREHFRDSVARIIKERHTIKHFDIIESPEYGAEGYYIKKTLPDVPLVVKFHSPDFLIKELNHYAKQHRLKYRIKKFIGLGRYHKERDKEYILSIGADGLVSPSVSLKTIVHHKWGIPADEITVLANPFFAKKEFLDLSLKETTNRVSYIGRLEARKGAHLFADIIPSVLKRNPNTLFRFIGKTNIGPDGKGTMLGFLTKKLGAYLNHVEFIDHVTSDEIPGLLQQTDVCVFPSLWENFPNVCLEAMSAGKGIVASVNGGMQDMLKDIDGGILIDPYDTEAISDAISLLLNDKQKRIEMGERCRQKIICYYGKEVPELHLKYYQSIIAKKKH